MERMAHGCTAHLEYAATNVAANGDIAEPQPKPSFCYLFEKLQEPVHKEDALLPDSTETRPEILAALAELGATMNDKTQLAKFNSKTPSAYTYFGQFIDHDISLTKLPQELIDPCELDKESLAPWSYDSIVKTATNKRSKILELESIYGDGSIKNGDEFVLEPVSDSDHPIKVSDLFHDLPRTGLNLDDPKKDRMALIPDRRNDSNLIISQMHVAFLRAHNQILKNETNCTFEQAQQILTRQFHWIVINDFLMKRVADPAVVRSVLSSADPLYKPTADNVVLPLEFTVAAYRFGHCMIRNTYYLNTEYPGDDLLNLFVLNVLSDHSPPTFGKGFAHIPQKRIINWDSFIYTGTSFQNLARKIRTQMADPLFSLLDETDRTVPCEKRLAVQDLKRGYMLRIPTGQAVARELGYTELSPDNILEHSAPNQRELLQKFGFTEKTPLWFYILVEAMAQQNGDRLGEVGSRIVAEVLIGLIRKSPHSYLTIDGFSPKYTNPQGEFELADLFKLAGVLK